MRVLVIENYRATPLGLVGGALADAGADIDLVRAFDGEGLPAGHDSHDALVILGGDQTALDDDAHPYLPALAGLSRAFGEADKAVLGICLGAQLVARGHGAENILGRPVEFGWHPVEPTPAGRDDPLMAALGDGAPVFHWHSDTFNLPPGRRTWPAATGPRSRRFGLAALSMASNFTSRPTGRWYRNGTRPLRRKSLPIRRTGSTATRPRRRAMAARLTRLAQRWRVAGSR